MLCHLGHTSTIYDVIPFSAFDFVWKETDVWFWFVQCSCSCHLTPPIYLFVCILVHPVFFFSTCPHLFALYRWKHCGFALFKRTFDRKNSKSKCNNDVPLILLYCRVLWKKNRAGNSKLKRCIQLRMIRIGKLPIFIHFLFEPIYCWKQSCFRSFQYSKFIVSNFYFQVFSHHSLSYFWNYLSRIARNILIQH